MDLPKLWGIGFPRTGTTSLATAFLMLGYQKVAHNPFFEELTQVDAATDAGCAVFYKYLFYRFPNSKFILTTREIENWMPSVEFLFRQHPIHEGCANYDRLIQRRSLMWGTIVFDRKKVTEAYHRHTEDVRTFFSDKPEALLEMDICKGEGWEKICPFMGIPVLKEAFPAVNSIDAVRRP